MARTIWKRRKVKGRHGKLDGRVERREQKLEAALALLVESPRTVAELALLLGLSHRTVYLLLREIAARGRVVARTGSRALGQWRVL